MKFTETHEWVKVENNVATIGVSQYAQEELGDIVYVELPEVGKSVNAGEEAAVLESTKAAADVYSPLSGKIIEVNESLSDASELVNQSPESKGWIFKIELSDPVELDKLMSAEDYHAKVNP